MLRRRPREHQPTGQNACAEAQPVTALVGSMDDGCANSFDFNQSASRSTCYVPNWLRCDEIARVRVGRTVTGQPTDGNNTLSTCRDYYDWGPAPPVTAGDTDIVRRDAEFRTYRRVPVRARGGAEDHGNAETEYVGFSAPQPHVPHVSDQRPGCETLPITVTRQPLNVPELEPTLPCVRPWFFGACTPHDVGHDCYVPGHRPLAGDGNSPPAEPSFKVSRDCDSVVSLRAEFSRTR